MSVWRTVRQVFRDERGQLLGGLLTLGGGALGGLLAGREQAKRLRGVKGLMQPLGGAAAEPLFRQAADIAANQAIAAGFGRSGAQVIGTRQALNDIILRDLLQRRQLAGLALGQPGAMEVGIAAGGGLLSQLGGLLGGGEGGIFGRDGGGGGLLSKTGGLLRGGFSKLGGLLTGGGATASTLSAGGLAGLPTAGTTLGGLFGGTAAGGTTLAAPGAFGGTTALTSGAGATGGLGTLGALGAGAGLLSLPLVLPKLEPALKGISRLITGKSRAERMRRNMAAVREARTAAQRKLASPPTGLASDAAQRREARLTLKAIRTTGTLPTADLLRGVEV